MLEFEYRRLKPKITSVAQRSAMRVSSHRWPVSGPSHNHAAATPNATR